MALPRTVTVADVLTQNDGTPEVGVIKIAQRVDLRAGADGAGPGIITRGMRTARLAPDGSFTLTVYANDDPEWSPQGWSHRITIALLGHTETYDVLLPYQAGPYTLAELLPLLTPTAGAMYAPIGHTHPGGGGGGSTAWDDLTGVPSTFPPSAHNHVQTDVTGLTAALAGKAATVHTHAQGDVTGLVTALAAKADLVAGVIPTAQIPAVALVAYLGTAANQAAMLAKVGQPGDWINRTDTGTTWQITGADPTVLGNWTEMLYPASPVQSVAGRTGAVTLAKADVGLPLVDNTSDAGKPVSTAQANALALKAPIASPTFTGTVSGVTAAMVGLPNVTNTSDADKPVSTAQQAALDAKLPLLRTWNGSAYVADPDALVYAGPTDPGAVPDGTVWIEV
jgi:hypothetical protein